jgi:hypothetical protein
MVARMVFHLGDHLMMMMTTRVRSMRKVVKRATMLVSQQSILVGASSNPLSNSGDHSGHGGDEPVADKENMMEDDLVDYDSDPYESAMRNQPDAAGDSVFRVECHSRVSNTPQDKVYFLLFLLYYILLFFSFRFSFPLFSFGCCRSMPYIYRFNDRYSSSPKVGSVDVAAPSFIPELVFRVVAF